MNYLLDTCVISEPIKKQPNQQVVSWLAHVEQQHCFLSIITIGELLKGIHKLNLQSQSEKFYALEQWVQHDLMLRFAQHIIPIDLNIMTHWGRISGQAEKLGNNCLSQLLTNHNNPHLKPSLTIWHDAHILTYGRSHHVPFIPTAVFAYLCVYFFW